MSESESSTESEPEQFPEIPTVVTTKLERPKRKLTENQLKALADARERRRINKAQPTVQPDVQPTVQPAVQPAVKEASNKKKALSKMNKKELQEQAQLLNIDIEGMSNDEIKKKLRGSTTVEPIASEQPSLEKKDKSVKSKVIKEVHHHHYTPPTEEASIKPVIEKKPKVEKKSRVKKEIPNMTVKKETNIINFV